MNNTLNFEQFIISYAKPKDECKKYKQYDIKIQKVAKEIYLACRRFMLNPIHTLYILNIIFRNLEDMSINSEDYIKNLKKEEMNIKSIADYLNCTTQAVYNFKHRIETQKEIKHN